MNLQDLKPASEFAKIYGCKVCCYGPPGHGKTPLVNSAPRPILLATEPGLLSMRGSTVPTFQAFDTKKIDEFFDWFMKSNDSKQFDTLAIDSGSELAGISLAESLNRNKHGMKAYGDMAEYVETHLRKLYFMPNKHIFIIAKQEIITESNFKRPYFPGKYLPVQIPHLFDFILNLDIHPVPGMGQVKALQCAETFDRMARARTGNLNMYEPPDLGALFRKAMS